MSIDLYALIEHHGNYQDLPELVQLLSNLLSVYCKTNRYPVLDHFYMEAKGDGELIISEELLKKDLMAKDWCQNVLGGKNTIPILNGLGLEIEFYKNICLIDHRSDDRWPRFVIDPIRRLNFRKDVQIVANFFKAKYVIYLPDDFINTDFEDYTLAQYTLQLESQGYYLADIQFISNSVKNWRSPYDDIGSAYYIDYLENPISSESLELLSKLQLSILAIALDEDGLSYLQEIFPQADNLLKNLAELIWNYSQRKIDVIKSLPWELTEEQTLLLESLDVHLTAFFRNQTSNAKDSCFLWNDSNWMVIQQLAKQALVAFQWKLFELSDWLKHIEIADR